MKWEEIAGNIWHQHRGKVIGIGIGLFFGLLAVIVGLLKTLFVAICVGIGYVLGKRADDEGDLHKIIDRLFGD